MPSFVCLFLLLLLLLFPYTTIRPFENFIWFLVVRLSVLAGPGLAVASLLPPAIERNLWTSRNSIMPTHADVQNFVITTGGFTKIWEKQKTPDPDRCSTYKRNIDNFFYIWRRRQLFSLCMWSTWECVCGFLPSWCGGWNFHCVRVRNLRVFYADVICNIWKFSLQNTLNKKISKKIGTKKRIGIEKSVC